MKYNFFLLFGFLVLAPGLLRMGNYVAALLALVLLIVLLEPKKHHVLLAGKHRRSIQIVAALSLSAAIYFG